MFPMSPGEGSLSEGDAAPEQQESETSVSSFHVVAAEGRSGRVFVLVMGAVFVVIAAGLFLASRSM